MAIFANFSHYVDTIIVSLSNSEVLYICVGDTDVWGCRPCIAQAGFRFWGKESSQPPGIPKKPSTAFMAFFNEKRSSIMDANPGTTDGNILFCAMEAKLECSHSFFGLAYIIWS